MSPSGISDRPSDRPPSKIERRKQRAIAYTKRYLGRRKITLEQFSSNLAKMGVSVDDINKPDQLYNAVKRLQRKLKTTVDGRYGPTTHRKMGRAMAAKESSETRNTLGEVVITRRDIYRLNYLWRKRFIKSRYTRKQLSKRGISDEKFVNNMKLAGIEGVEMEDDKKLIKVVYLLQKRMGLSEGQCDGEYGRITHKAFVKYLAKLNPKLEPKQKPFVRSPIRMARPSTKPMKNEKKPRLNQASAEVEIDVTPKDKSLNVNLLGEKRWPFSVKASLINANYMAKKHGYSPGQKASEKIYYKGKDGEYHMNVAGMLGVLYSLREWHGSHNNEKESKKVMTEITSLEKAFNTLAHNDYPVDLYDLKKHLPRQRRVSSNAQRKEYYRLRSAIRKNNEESPYAIAKMRAHCLKSVGTMASRYGNETFGFDEDAAFVFDPPRGAFVNARIRDFYSHKCNLRLVVYRKAELVPAKKNDNYEDLYNYAEYITLNPKTGEFVDNKGHRVRINRGDVIAEGRPLRPKDNVEIKIGRDRNKKILEAFGKVEGYLSNELDLDVEVTDVEVENHGISMEVDYGGRSLTFGFSLKELVDAGVIYPPTDKLSKIHTINLAVFTDVIRRKYYKVFVETEMRAQNREEIEGIDPKKGSVICAIGTHERGKVENNFVKDKNKFVEMFSEKYNSEDVFSHQGPGITRRNFLRLLKRSVKTCLNKDKDLIFYFSGHSSTKKLINAYLFSSSGGIATNEVYRIFRPLLDNGNKIFMVLDGCEIGIWGRKLKHKNLTILVGSRPGQSSEYDDSTGSSFTMGLIGAMKSNSNLTLGQAYLKAEDKILYDSSSAVRGQSKTFQEPQLYKGGKQLASRSHKPGTGGMA